MWLQHCSWVPGEPGVPRPAPQQLLQKGKDGGEEAAARSVWRKLLDVGEDASGKREGKSQERIRIMNER